MIDFCNVPLVTGKCTVVPFSVLRISTLMAREREELAIDEKLARNQADLVLPSEAGAGD
jgi:hypothetical protein